MTMTITTLDERTGLDGFYSIRRQRMEMPGDPASTAEVEGAFNFDGIYIGDIKIARYLCEEMRIHPEPCEPGSDICSIGKSEIDGKWYGWSHRAIHGFAIGDKVERGDCAYKPANLEDARVSVIAFWSDPGKVGVTATDIITEDGRPAFGVLWQYDETVPNEELRSKISGIVSPHPEVFGRGEWTAMTEADAVYIGDVAGFITSVVVVIK